MKVIPLTENERTNVLKLRAIVDDAFKQEAIWRAKRGAAHTLFLNQTENLAGIYGEDPKLCEVSEDGAYLIVKPFSYDRT